MQASSTMVGCRLLCSVWKHVALLILPAVLLVSHHQCNYSPLQSALRNFRPLLDRVLVQRLAPETVSRQFMVGRHVAMETDLLHKLQ